MYKRSYYARKLDKEFKIYEKRNYGVYVSLNKKNDEGLTLKDFNPDDVELMHTAVNERIKEYKNAIDLMERLKKK
ncbi:MAG: hypothetical protein P8Y97_08905 [Candidatus Lokiarchaeota archaeon]